MDTQAVVLLEEIKVLLQTLVIIFGLVFLVFLLKQLPDFFSAIKNIPKNMLKRHCSKMYYNREYDALINLCTKAIKRHPYSPTAYWYLALSHRQKEDYVSAKKYFLQLLELAPSWEKEFVEPYFRDGEVIPSVKSEN